MASDEDPQGTVPQQLKQVITAAASGRRPYSRIEIQCLLAKV